MVKLSSFVNTGVSSVIENRKGCMGIAMIMVLLYHFNQIYFYPGFLGVDFFLFLSAYGLCKSFDSNSLSVFFKHRLQRILPMYIFMGIGMSIVAIKFLNKQLSGWDWFCNISSLNYYGLGGFVFEWYLSFLLLMYFLFPLLCRLGRLSAVTKNGGVFYCSSL